MLFTDAFSPYKHFCLKLNVFEISRDEDPAFFPTNPDLAGEKCGSGSGWKKKCGSGSDLKSKRKKKYIPF